MGTSESISSVLHMIDILYFYLKNKNNFLTLKLDGKNVLIYFVNFVA